MPDFIDRLGTELVRAARTPADAERQPQAGWRPRLTRSASLRPLVIALVLAILAAAAALASGVLAPGSSVAPEGPPIPTANQGAAIPSTAQLLPLRVADPVGGPSWGLRVLLTTRGDACLQVGRLAYGTIGALGQDGAFGDDHRFHPFSDNYLDPFSCVTADAHGHGFASISLSGFPASGMAPGQTQAAAGCLGGRSLNRCPAADTRDLYYGLLGPDAVSISYVSSDGRQMTVRTVGPSGAYLIVTRLHTGEQQGSAAVFTGLLRTGPIRGVTYRDGHTCRPSLTHPCPAIGFVPLSLPRPTPAALATPIRVREVPARSYCAAHLGSVIRPCGALAPSGFSRLPALPAELLVEVTYTARVAVTGSGSYYYVAAFFPHSHSCGEYATSAPTLSDIRAGQRVTDYELVEAGCHGLVRGVVRYHRATQPNDSMPGSEPDLSDPSAIPVGRFSFRIP